MLWKTEVQTYKCNHLGLCNHLWLHQSSFFLIQPHLKQPTQNYVSDFENPLTFNLLDFYQNSMPSITPKSQKIEEKSFSCYNKCLFDFVYKTYLIKADNQSLHTHNVQTNNKTMLCLHYIQSYMCVHFLETKGHKHFAMFGL